MIRGAKQVGFPAERGPSPEERPVSVEQQRRNLGKHFHFSILPLNVACRIQEPSTFSRGAAQ